MKSLTSISHRRTSTSVPKKLEIYTSALPDIISPSKLTDHSKENLFETTGHTRRHSSVNSTRPLRQIPVPKPLQNICYGEFVRQPKLNALRERMKLRRLNALETPAVIYKSEIQDILSIQTPANISLKDTENTEQRNQEESEKKKLKQIKELLNSNRFTRKGAAMKKLPIAWSNTSKKLLSRIFQKQQYQDKFDYINKILLKNDYLYKGKASTSQIIDQQWKY